MVSGSVKVLGVLAAVIDRSLVIIVSSVLSVSVGIGLGGSIGRVIVIVIIVVEVVVVCELVVVVVVIVIGSVIVRELPVGIDEVVLHLRLVGHLLIVLSLVELVLVEKSKSLSIFFDAYLRQIFLSFIRSVFQLLPHAFADVDVEFRLLVHKKQFQLVLVLLCVVLRQKLLRVRLLSEKNVSLSHFSSPGLVRGLGRNFFLCRALSDDLGVFQVVVRRGVRSYRRIFSPLRRIFRIHCKNEHAYVFVRVELDSSFLQLSIFLHLFYSLFLYLLDSPFYFFLKLLV